MVDDSRPALVAVIEDDALARAALGRVLQAGGYEPALFDSAESFLSSRPSAALHCLIVDVQLTGMSGLALQGRLRFEGFEVPVIVITGNRVHAIRERAEHAGCAGFLWKPFSAETILTLLASIGRQSLPG